MERLFVPFNQADSSITRQYGGSGLGLAITRNMVTLLGGDIAVSSERHVGSVFTITLPVEHGSAAAETPAPLPQWNERQFNVVAGGRGQ